jgi:WXG100 family type VII secretion target
MTRINLVHDAMHRSIGQTRAARDRLAEDRRTAGTSVHSLLTGGWQGIAADAFAEAWTEWLEAADRVAEGLEAMASLLEAHQRDMARQDDSSQHALDAISARIIDRLG